MYHLLKGLHAHLTRKDEYSVVIIGLDNVGLRFLQQRRGSQGYELIRYRQGKQ